ncbi:type I-C CRISPR-associated protein Cas8c/Csd1 [Paenibacillus sp. J22TS3]|uniref:type I-C CRISPR-associated protein Cas8c/Csd1 n=1 Tax=Paenibacillus sp. J22TS3 TaxID=2807192 RepID=UPI001B061ADC|nr:type I-C CRISPR-associated protein Cas8c/Csd1 [Paenibacillus sp. J22TS3]GIP22862.1 type I-C CRISPR-associated protein Cas8c/Csd1 [Paenibacillus sp. J22TS3]
MTWLAKLYDTFEDNAHVVGQFEKKSNDREYALIPVSHTTQSAHIEVNLDEKGNFVSAKVVDKSDGSTIIPCTEASSSRTSKPVPHALFDKLVYVAGDYSQYCGEAKGGTQHCDYMTQLKEWCESPVAHPKVQSVYSYLLKGTLMTDLIREKILWVDEHGKLLDKCTPLLEEQYGGKPDIFKVLAGDQSAAFVRFAVQVPGEPEARLWRDPSVQESFIQFNEMKLADQELCYVLGEKLPYADKHASRIRNSADKSKLISANDTSGFTYRGRFTTSRDAAAISYQVSQKAHNALKWLIERQGYTLDGRVFLVWGTGEQNEVPDPFQDSFPLYQDEEETGGDRTHKEFANQIKRGISGYRYEGDYKSEVIIMILDAATSGRMSIVYYRDINKEMFLDQLLNWHTTCAWLHRYRKDSDNRFIAFYGAPATRDIAFAVYGPRANDKLIKSLMERMLPCIVDGRKIPLDIVRSAVQRASNPVGMEEWEWEKSLSITCALVNKHYEQEGFTVSLDMENTNRDYLFGRMLAIADVLERRALGRDEKRASNAIRYMNAFAQRPGRTWTIIQSNLQPYQAKLGTDARYYNSLLDEVGSKLRPEDYNDTSLSGLYLLGFYSQRHDLYTSKKQKEQESTDMNEAQNEQEDL